MFEFPHISSFNKLEDVITAINNDAVPAKFTYRYLAKIGFPSSKDREFIPAFKLLGLIDDQGHPTAKYTNLRDVQRFELGLGEAIEEAYAKLFETDPDANNVSESVLTGYFGKLTGGSHQKSTIYAKTFLELVRISNFEHQPNLALNAGKESSEKEIKPQESAMVAARNSTGLKGTKAANINLNINLPTTTDGKVYESLFKHLKDLITPE